FPFFFSLAPGHPHLPSFPTRRSSDLAIFLTPHHDRLAALSARDGRGNLDPARRGPYRGRTRHQAWRRGARAGLLRARVRPARRPDRKSTRLNSSHVKISYAVFCLKKK